MRTVTATEDWLSYALAEMDTEKLAASNKRAEAALKVRLDQRVTKFLKRATDADELGERLDVVDPAVQEIVDEVATEYGASPEHLLESSVKTIAATLGVPCPNRESAEGSLRERLLAPRVSAAADDDAGHDAYQHERVNPDSIIGDTPASSAFEGTKYDTSVEKALDGSKDHPREFQNVADHVEDRRTLNDGTDKSVGVERAVGSEDLGGSDPHTEQKGKGGTFTEGDRGSAGAADAVTSKFHILD